MALWMSSLLGLSLPSPPSDARHQAGCQTWLLTSALLPLSLLPWPCPLCHQELRHHKWVPQPGRAAGGGEQEQVQGPRVPVSGPGSRVVRLRARPNSSSQSLPPYIHPDMHQIYTKSHAFATSQISVTMGGASIKTFEFSRDISYSSHNRNHITI